MPISPHPVSRLQIIGLCLSMVSILYGFVIGGAFGIMEDSMKGQLNESGVAVLDTVYEGDVEAKDAVVAKSWEYLKRSHLHGGAIGAAGVGVILSMIVLCRPSRVAGLSALAFGLGAIIYSVFWLAAGFMAPGMGSTDAAKGALEFMAVPGAGLTLIGLCGAMYSVVKSGFEKPPSTT